jgi:hypothetical protein
VRQRFIVECDRFERCCDGPPRNGAGLSQFHSWESSGIMPAEPDPYFRRLCDGKAWWEWTINEYASTYGTFEWPGWTQLAEDFAGDEAGLRQIRRRCGQ